MRFIEKKDMGMMKISYELEFDEQDIVSLSLEPNARILLLNNLHEGKASDKLLILRNIVFLLEQKEEKKVEKKI